MSPCFSQGAVSLASRGTFRCRPVHGAGADRRRRKLPGRKHKSVGNGNSGSDTGIRRRSRGPRVVREPGGAGGTAAAGNGNGTPADRADPPPAVRPPPRTPSASAATSRFRIPHRYFVPPRVTTLRHGLDLFPPAIRGSRSRDRLLRSRAADVTRPGRPDMRGPLQDRLPDPGGDALNCPPPASWRRDRHRPHGRSTPASPPSTRVVAGSSWDSSGSRVPARTSPGSRSSGTRWHRTPEPGDWNPADPADSHYDWTADRQRGRSGGRRRSQAVD